MSNEEKIALKLEQEYKAKISYHVKNGNINLLEYSYLLNFHVKGGTMVNISWFISLANKIHNIEIKNNFDFANIVVQLFPTLLCINNDVSINNDISSDNSDDEIVQKQTISFNIEKLTKRIIKDKKDAIQFTNDQLQAINDIFNFLPNMNMKTYGLYGYAGTGKTTILIEILTFLLKNKLIKSIVLTAPTNKAVTVMKSKFRDNLNYLYNAFFEKDVPDNLTFDEILDKFYEIGIRIDFITIHKLLKFEMDFGSEGDMMFVKGIGDSMIGEYEMVVIDECSMIPMNLVEHIFNELRMHVQKKCDNFKFVPKIIFSGDPAQLPPVKEQLSIIFLNKKNEHMFNIKEKQQNLMNDIKNMDSIVLKKVMRSKLPAVTNICYQVRLWAVGDVKVPDMKKYIKDGVFAYKYNNEKKTTNEWFNKCLKYCRSGKDSNIILTWTNKQADEYNNTIRKTLFKGENMRRFEIGDVLILNDFYNMNDVKNEEDESEKKFHTSEQIKVVKADIINKKTMDFVTTLNKKAGKLQNAKHYEVRYRQAIDEINQLKRIYSCWKLTVTRLTDDDMTYVIYVINDDAWNNEKEQISLIIKNLRKSLLSKFRDKTIQIETNIIKPLWKEWHKNMIGPFANVNYGYAITCHKGQGSNFYNVFVDLDDIVKNDNDNETKKCVYTAMTRTSNELHILL